MSNLLDWRQIIYLCEEGASYCEIIKLSNNMLKIPYGESDFHKFITNKYLYLDRTQFIEKLENWPSKYLVFLRPRRFGKSLFISILQHYYGLEHKEEFSSLFGQYYIGKHPTSLANSYLILRLEFSRIDTATHESTYRGFLDNVVTSVHQFLSAYKQFFTDQDQQNILTQTSPEGVLKALFSVISSKSTHSKIYVLIDEYDHFANELLSFDLDRFKSDVSTNGFVRKFYESLKTATGEGIIDRIFITGVSPITLDSLTSGFNIGSNITINPIFHDMMGFTHAEVKEILHKFQIPQAKIPEILSDLAEWYDGYQFASSRNQPLFNPDMILYFLQQYGIDNSYPEVMLDTNVVSDYRKIRNIFSIGQQEVARFELLEQLVQKGHIDFPLTLLFNLEHEFTQDDFLSLLYYMGMLSFKEKSLIGWRCEIPNYVIKKLYFEYFTAIFLAQTRFGKATRPIGQAVTALLGKGNLAPFLKIVEQVLVENHSNRDELVYGEKHLQTLMIGLLFPYESYFIHSEYESKRGYPDIFLERLPNTPLEFDIVLELKYVKKSAKDKLDTVVEQVRKQLDGYMTSARFARPDVRGFYIVFFGGEAYEWGEWAKNSLQ
ncbi:MAG: AAA family ATPase [Bacteroidota bacterium]